MLALDVLCVRPHARRWKAEFGTGGVTPGGRPRSRLTCASSGLSAWLRRRSTAAVTAVAFFLAASRPASAGRKPPAPEPKGRIEVSFDGEPRELTGAEKVVCTLISAGAAGGLLYWGKISGDQEEAEEEERIKTETERLNKLRDEFLMDDEVVQDDDLFSSLRKRMEEAGNAPAEPEDKFDEGSSEGDGGGSPPPPPSPSGRPSAGGSALAEPPSTPQGPAASSEGPEGGDQAPGESRDADIERLKRMFGDGE